MKYLLLLILLFSPKLHAETASTFIPVLMYHKVVSTSAEASEFAIFEQEFNNQLKYLHDNNFNTILISDLTLLLNKKVELPQNTIAITLDDGWKSVLTAINIASKYNIKTTLFAVSGFVDNPMYLSNDDIAGLSNNPLVEIGAHSHTHLMEWQHDLTKVSDTSMVGEMAVSKQILEQITSKSVTSFAWPFGYTKPEFMKHVQSQGFTSTVLVNRDAINTKDTSPLAIKRINIDGRCSLNQFKTMVSTGKVQQCS
jgi:peptidoglycan/xylan/chitin deacetylase (PgdA/CDA1 family)